VEADGCVGKNGVTKKKREGDMKTPAGVYGLSFAFGTEKPGTALPFRPITDESYWVDDPESEYYNTWQEGKKDWKSAEKLSEYPKYYHYAVAVAYNEACTPGLGSAIFLHCKAKAYTSGCIAVPEARLLQMLKRLDPSKKPVILIGKNKKAIESYGIVELS
jgi:L,D-peptidoglycan transpeptidase YkuD (ErfK/YbiS/YcfS/YnhG family)